jgi:hypothetical protein
MNPGTTASQRLYQYADYVVAYEKSYAELALGKLPGGNLVKKAAIIVHSFPSSTRTLTTVLRNLVPKYAAVYVTNLQLADEDGASFSPFLTYLFLALFLPSIPPFSCDPPFSILTLPPPTVYASFGSNWADFVKQYAAFNVRATVAKARRALDLK